MWDFSFFLDLVKGLHLLNVTLFIINFVIYLLLLINRYCLLVHFIHWYQFIEFLADFPGSRFRSGGSFKEFVLLGWMLVYVGKFFQVEPRALAERLGGSKNNPSRQLADK